MRRAGSLLSALMLTACEPRDEVIIDGSSEAAFAATIEEARRELPSSDRLSFEAALKAPPGRSYGDSAEDVRAVARMTYDGMTAAQVVQIAGQ